MEFALANGITHSPTGELPRNRNYTTKNSKLQCTITQKFLHFCAKLSIGERLRRKPPKDFERGKPARPAGSRLSQPPIFLSRKERKERKEMEGGNGASAVTLCLNHAYQNDAAGSLLGSRAKLAKENLTQRTRSSQSFLLVSALRRKPPKIF